MSEIVHSKQGMLKKIACMSSNGYFVKKTIQSSCFFFKEFFSFFSGWFLRRFFVVASVI